MSLFSAVNLCNIAEWLGWFISTFLIIGPILVVTGILSVLEKIGLQLQAGFQHFVFNIWLKDVTTVADLRLKCQELRQYILGLSFSIHSRNE